MNPKNKMIISSDMKISDIIISNPYILLMLEHMGISMEVREKTLEQICRENNKGIELFLTIANLYNGFKSSMQVEFSSDNVRNIISFLKNSHQYYIEEKYPQIKSYIREIYKINNHAEILMVEKFFNKYFDEVIEHLNYENKIVFPYILKLDNLLLSKQQSNDIHAYSVKEYREHHNDIEEKLTDLKNLLIKYLPQNNDQQIRRTLIFCLFELEFDLKIHSQIEDAILIPMVEKMEQMHNRNNE